MATNSGPSTPAPQANLSTSPPPSPDLPVADKPLAPVKDSAKPPKTQDELERVRELILGSESIQQRFGKAEVDRIREIIFGTHMQDYERRFTDLRREMERVLAELRLAQDNANHFEQIQTKRLEDLETEIRQENAELRREVNRLRAQEAMLQQLLTQVRQQEILNQGTATNTKELGNVLSQQERDHRTFKAAVNEQRDLHERKLDTVRREVRQGLEELRTELRRLVDRLDDQKTDRKALAAMLIEVAARLETGSNVTGLLEELPGSARE